MVTRIMMSVSQNEIERTSERTKVGMAGAIKQGHIPAVCPIGFKRVDKKLVPDPLTKDIVIRIFNLYFDGNSYSTIANIFNKEKVLGKTNWKDTRILKILSNELYKGDYVSGKTINKPIYYERRDFYDGSGLPNSDLFLNVKYNIIYILILFFILL